MGALSDDEAANLLNAKFNGATLDVPASYWIALSSTEPADDGTNVTEPTGSYARQEAPVDTTTFPTTTTRQILLHIDLTYPDPGMGDDWGALGWYAVYDDPTAGSFHGWGRFGDSLHVADGDTGPVIPADTIVITAPGS